MGTDLEGAYSGRIEPDNDNGGTCSLALAGGRFELQIVRTAPYSIEDGDILRGGYTEGGDGVTLQAREHHSWHWETVKQEWTGPSSRRIEAAYSGPTPDRAEVLDILIEIGGYYRVLLMRESASQTEWARPDLVPWVEAKRDRRRAELEARRAESEARRARTKDEGVSIQAAEAFRAKDYRRVVKLLEPLAARLSPADRKKLELARKRK